ncbi:MAG: VOC family protein [Longimicrobiales bacterium]
MENSFGLNKVGQIYVTVHDLDRAVGFYRDVLGMKFLFQVPNMAFFDCSGVRIMLGLPESEKFDHPASILYYDVTDIAAAHGILRDRGVMFTSDPHKVADLGTKELWIGFLDDSEGNVVGIMSEIPKRA